MCVWTRWAARPRRHRSQVALMGQVDAELSRMAWRGRSASVSLRHAQASMSCGRTDVVVVGAPARQPEINRHDSDIVNMRVALHANARCLLVSDIDRGGAFAHLYGTWGAAACRDERALIHGFVLNKFRDASLLAPAPADAAGPDRRAVWWRCCP